MFQSKLLKLVSLAFGCVTLTLTLPALAQSDSTTADLRLSAFADVFYAFDFNLPEGGSRQDFFFNHNRHNEFNLNLGLLRFEVDHDRFRSRISLQSGTYANDNYAAEAGVLQNVFEAQIGMALGKAGKTWVDAGIFPSHIGFESALSVENPTLSRSLAAENSPYFLSGLRLSHAVNAQLDVELLVVNGWQRIQRVPGSSMPSLGSRVYFHPNERFAINWSTFAGTDDPDSTRRYRLFNNLYSQMQLSNRLALTLGFDVGAQQAAKGSNELRYWGSAVAIAALELSDTWATALRAEYYRDPHGVIVNPAGGRGFSTAAWSVNLDHRPNERLWCRFEIRHLHAPEATFVRGDALVRDNLVVMASMALLISDLR